MNDNPLNNERLQESLLLMLTGEKGNLLQKNANIKGILESEDYQWKLKLVRMILTLSQIISLQIIS